MPLMQLKSVKRNHLILVDIEMPDMSGIEMVNKLKELNVVDESSIVFISVSNEAEVIIKCFEMGADDFISKSIGGAAIVKKINSLLAFHRKIKSQDKKKVELTSLVDTTMKQASFYGSCLNLLSDLQACQTEE